MKVDNNFDAVVIGAGIIGASITLELTRNGRRTLCIDKLPAAGYGSTSSSCAIVRVHYSTLSGTALAYDSYFDWKSWRSHLNLQESEEVAIFHETGCLVMKTRENNFLEKVISNAKTLNIPFEEWDAENIKNRLPTYNLKRFSPPCLQHEPQFGQPTYGDIEKAIFFSTAGFVNDPQFATKNIQLAAERMGARFCFKKEVVQINSRKSQITDIVLDDGVKITTPVVVNVTGPHSSVINKMANADYDMRITTKPLRQEVAYVPAPDQYNLESSNFVISDNDIGIYCRPESGGNLLIGSEDPVCDEPEYVDADSFDRNLSFQSQTQVMRYAQRMTDLGVPNSIKGIVDLYDVTEDWLPIYDCSAIKGFYMACGTSGNQFKNAPGVGRLMSGLIEYCESGNHHDSDPFQFNLKNLNQTFDTRIVSRLRSINRESSFSVLG